MSGGMKKGNQINVSGWRDLIQPVAHEIPPGYSTATQIAEASGLSANTIMRKLKELRDSGKIDAIRINDGKNVIWVYKD